jgi:hypothetical protein
MRRTPRTTALVLAAVTATATLQLGGAATVSAETPAAKAAPAAAAAVCSVERTSTWTPTQSRPTSGYSAIVRITNTGTIPIIGWTATADLATNDKVTSASSASATQWHGQAYMWAFAPEGNEIVAPGASTQFSFSVNAPHMAPSNGVSYLTLAAAGLPSVTCTGTVQNQPLNPVPTTRCSIVKTGVLPPIPGTSWHGYTATVSIHTDLAWPKKGWTMQLAPSQMGGRITAVTGVRKKTNSSGGWASYTITPNGNSVVPANGSVSYGITFRSTDSTGNMVLFADGVACGMAS